MALLDPAIAWSFAVALALLLAAGAAHKLGALSKFFGVVRNYKLAPAGAAPLIGAAVIAAELGIAAGLVAPATRPIAGVAAAFLFAAYALAIGINIARGRVAIDCGCSFGASDGEHRLTPWMLVRNGVLAAGALLLAAPQAHRAIGALDIASIVIFTAAAAVLYAAFEVLSAQSAKTSWSRDGR